MLSLFLQYAGASREWYLAEPGDLEHWVKCFALSSTKSKRLDLGSTKIIVIGYLISSKPPQQYVNAELVQSDSNDGKFSTDVWRRIFISKAPAGTTPFFTLYCLAHGFFFSFFLLSVIWGAGMSLLGFLQVDLALVLSHLWIYQSWSFVDLLPNYLD